MENNKKKPVIAYVVALIMGLHFLYKGVKLSSIGDMIVFGVLLVICGVVLIGASIFMLCKKPTKKNE